MENLAVSNDIWKQKVAHGTLTKSGLLANGQKTLVGYNNNRDVSPTTACFENERFICIPFRHAV